MSIVLDRIEPSGIALPMACVGASVFESSPDLLPEDRRAMFVAGEPASERKEDELEWCSSSSTSSIGRNSDLSDGDDSEDNEVQSSFKGPLNSMEALEEVLPIKRSISKFYNGKSKSFASLADASSSSVKDIAKPENAYSRKRRNLLAINHVWDKNRNLPLKSNGGGISKKPISSSRSTLALAFAMSSSETNSNTSDDSNSSSITMSPPRLPPLHPQVRANHNKLLSRLNSPWRSFSVADIQQCANIGPEFPYCSSTCHNSNHELSN